MSIHAQAARAVVEDALRALELEIIPAGPILAHAFSADIDLSASSAPICIIGAGCTGLYTAMILDKLGLEYEILEANKRIGGRIFTHRFNGDDGKRAPVNDPARYDYVDIGAMRYPLKLDIMKRVRRLFEELKLHEDGLLVDYKFSADDTFEMYNDIRHRKGSPVDVADVFQVSQQNGGTVPDDWVKKGVDEVTTGIFRPHIKELEDNFKKGWEKLRRFDKHSTRGYLLTTKPKGDSVESPYSVEVTDSLSDTTIYPESVVEWLETFNTGTGLYNNAFVESVMDAMDFGSPHATQLGQLRSSLNFSSLRKEPELPSWVCIDGGSDIFIDRMVDRIQYKPVTGSRVVRIESAGNEMKVTSKQDGAPTVTKSYSQVICTVPLGCLQAIDFPQPEDLGYLKRLAIRSLNYDTSTKVAIKFATRWWEDPTIMPDGLPIFGGTSSTDLPIRTCVYPSYGKDATGPLPGVLLASYTWAQDAQRLGGLANRDGSSDEELKELVLNNLSKLHGVPVEKMGKVEGFFAWNWHTDPNARGAFALFGPGQFGQTGHGDSLFAGMKAPGARGKLHIAGEATSANHAWVLGSLNSAWRAVYNALGMLPGPDREAKRKILRDEKEFFGGVPPEDTIDSLLKLEALGKKQYYGF